MSDVKACQNKVHGFIGQAVQPIGVISLLVELGEGEQKATRIQDFVIIDEPSAYNAFLGRPTLAAFRITMALWRLTMKFPAENGVGRIIGDQQAARECYLVELAEARKKELKKDVEPSLCIQNPSYSN